MRMHVTDFNSSLTKAKRIIFIKSFCPHYFPHARGDSSSGNRRQMKSHLVSGTLPACVSRCDIHTYIHAVINVLYICVCMLNLYSNEFACLWVFKGVQRP